MEDGYGVVPGRDRATAVKLLAIADDLGLPVEVVRTVGAGYEVPIAVLDQYDAGLRASDEAIEDESDADAELLTPTEDLAEGEEQADLPEQVEEPELETPDSPAYVPETSPEAEEQGYDPAIPDATLVTKPKLNASYAKWHAYAQTRDGYTDSDAGLTRDELAAKFAD